MPVNNSAPAKTDNLISRKEKAEIVRQRVIKVALEDFAIHGFAGAKLKKIAENAGISLPLLVYHFESKEKLWETALLQAARRFDKEIRKLNTPADRSSINKLHQLVISLVNICTEFPEFHRIMAMESYHSTDRLIFLCKKCAHYHHKSMIEILSKAQADNPRMNQISAQKLCHVMIYMARMSSNLVGYKYLNGPDSKIQCDKKAIIEDIYSVLRIETKTS